MSQIVDPNFFFFQFAVEDESFVRHDWLNWYAIIINIECLCYVIPQLRGGASPLVLHGGGHTDCIGRRLLARLLNTSQCVAMCAPVRFEHLQCRHMRGFAFAAFRLQRQCECVDRSLRGGRRFDNGFAQRSHIGAQAVDFIVRTLAQVILEAAERNVGRAALHAANAAVRAFVRFVSVCVRTE